MNWDLSNLTLTAAILLIVGNCFTVIGYLIDFWAGIKFRDKKILIRTCYVSSGCSVIAMLFLGSIAGAINAAVTILRLMCINYKDIHKKKMTWAFCLFFILYATAFIDYEGIWSWILFISSMISFVPKWFSNDTQHLRWGGLVSCILTIFYSIHIKNVAAVPFLIFNILGIIIGLTKWYIIDWKEKNKIKN